MKQIETLPLIKFFEVKAANEFPLELTKDYHTHLFCQKGKIRFVFNDEEMECNAGNFIFWFADSRIAQLSTSKNFKAYLLLTEKEFLMNNLPDHKQRLDSILHSTVFPVKIIHSPSDRKRVLYNFQEINRRFLETDHHYHQDILKLQMKVFVLEMWDIFFKEYERKKHSLQSNSIFENYVLLLQEFCLKHREVKFYSEKLNITPKYLNHICISRTNTSASKWIQRYAKERIIVLLNDPKMNITQIAQEMEFSSVSFFTRYVKKLLGETPSEYRIRLR